MSSNYPVSDYVGTYSTVQYVQNGSSKTFDSFASVNSEILSNESKDNFLAQYQQAHAFSSEVEKAILEASNPLSIKDLEEINVNGVHGLLLNKNEISDWNGSIPIDQYEINDDPNPVIVNKKSEQEIEYIQELAVSYLRPPTPPPPGEIVIKQEGNLITPPAPPLIIRQMPPKPHEPMPIIIREAPPEPPQPVGRKMITISGKRLPPPPRKLIIEKFEELPPKPQHVLVERWLPYIPQKRRVIFQAAPPDPVIAKPRNVIIQWEAPKTVIKKNIKYLGITRMNPVDYVKLHGNTIRNSNTLPDIVNEIKTPESLLLAASVEYSGLYELEGDVHALNKVDLDKVGLSEYKEYLQNFNSRPTTQIGTSISSDSLSLSAGVSNNFALELDTIQPQPLIKVPVNSNTTLPRISSLGFPRANSAVYGSAITSVNVLSLASDSIDNLPDATLKSQTASKQTQKITKSGIGLDFDPSSRAVSISSMSNVSDFGLLSKSPSISAF